MRAVIQRVARCEVRVAPDYVARIGRGLLVYLGVAGTDGEADLEYVAGKIAGLRIFNDADGKMNRSVVDEDGAVMLVSQFTLYGDARRGRRPSFITAAAPEQAEDLYERLLVDLRRLGLRVAGGQFRSHMEVDAVNDGPVTILIDSSRAF